MLRLALVALACARALALPTAPGNALAPHGLERNTHGAKCCQCTHNGGNFVNFEEWRPCWKQAQCKDVHSVMNARKLVKYYPEGCEKEICDKTCKWYGEKADKFHGECDEDDRVQEKDYCNRYHEVERRLSQHTIVGLNPYDSEGSRSSAAMWN